MSDARGRVVAVPQVSCHLRHVTQTGHAQRRTLLVSPGFDGDCDGGSIMKRHGRFEGQLAQVELFREQTDRTMRDIERLFTPVTLPAGTVVTREGRAPSQFVVVVEGSLAVSAGNRFITTRGPGDHLGEISLLGRRLQTATTLTTTPVHAYVASKSDFAALLVTAPGVEQALWGSTSHRLAELRSGAEPANAA
jgi:CRP/FNR family cyclic AMP-dependent transcriptional regulator